MVKIKIFKRDDWIHISITDNGVGIPKDKLQKLRSDLMSDASTRIGLDNVNKRLTLTYGSESTLHIYSKEGLGTCDVFPHSGSLLTLRPLVAMPSTKYFCAAKNSMISGRMDRKDIAITLFH